MSTTDAPPAWPPAVVSDRRFSEMAVRLETARADAQLATAAAHLQSAHDATSDDDARACLREAIAAVDRATTALHGVLPAPASGQPFTAPAISPLTK